MKYLLILLALLSSLYADVDPFEEDFLSTLEEVSEIATKTKLNIDETPSFVTVLHSNKLQKLGIDTVYEALVLVPGVQLSKEASGVPIAIFRGNTQKGEVKLMVDGVTINNAYRGSIYYYLDLPIELIKRIEVIRGPGSVLYGSTAISGVINIITNNSEIGLKNALFVSTSSYDAYKGGALFSTSFKDLRISVDSSYQKNNKKFQAGPDIYAQTGKSDQHLNDYSLGLQITDGAFIFSSRFKKSEAGNSHGIFNILDQNKNKFNNINESFFAQLSYTKDLNSNNKLMLLGGFNSYKQELEGLYLSAKDTLDIAVGNYKEYSYFVQADLLSQSLANNEFLLGAKVELYRAQEGDYTFASSSINIIDGDSKRDTISLYANNTYHLNANIDISAGVRYDDFSDYGSSFNPNIGAVYRYSDSLIFKTLYSHAYRAPFWLELTSNPDLKAETSDTLEAGVVLKQHFDSVLRLNIYVSNLDDMIKRDSAGYYSQFSKSELLGTELEYTYTPNAQMQLSLLASYIDAKDQDNNTIPDVANILSTAYLTYNLEGGFALGSLLKYTSSSKRSTTDNRDDFASNLTYDQTLSFTKKGLNIYLSIKDLFDAGVSYAAPQATYEDDFIGEGRVFVLKASMEF